ncbi:FtsK/SpoIIIE domain-containing protein [Sinomonas sp. P10A9]|uniref:FtsK/SpoIIIE domain-containing protein n=1 Tax=Sinomonas puerhi TaxID=3238584 RepID=A0AB39L101_9MICC
MELHCTLISPDPRSAQSGLLRRELVVEAARDTPGVAVALALASDLGAGGCTVDGLPLEVLTVGEPPLRNGAVLVAGGTANPPHPPHPLSLVVHTGPAAGTIIPLGRGAVRIGRSPAGHGRRAALTDPDLSREHAQLEVTDAGVVLRDLGSANGVWMEGRRIERAEVSTGQEFRLGASLCTLAFTNEAPLLDPEAGRSPHAPLRVTRHTPPSRRVAMITMAVLPLGVGVTMALVTGMWLFLAFTSVSAISILIPLLEGRTARRDFERRLRSAADDDAARRRRASPDAGVLARTVGVAATPAHDAHRTAERDPAEGVRAAALTSGIAVDVLHEVWVRMGTAAASANISIEPAASGGVKVAPPTVKNAPFVVPLRGRIAINGGTADVQGLLNSLLLQLAMLPAAAGLKVIVLGGSEETRLAARFLPRVQIDPSTASPESVAVSIPPGTRVALVILPGAQASAWVRAADDRGWPVVGAAGLVGTARPTVIRLSGAAATLAAEGNSTDFAPDLVPAPAFDAAARRAGAQPAVRGEAGVPNCCGLEEFVAMDPSGVSVAWARTASERSLNVPLGRSEEGIVTLDLVAQGPHLLVAGTTGSGKSELLRTLIAGAAATHAPDRLTFLFVDFKGGSGLEPLAGLPHCVGLVTDLAAGGMDRTLASLRAELKRRELLLATARASDLDDYRLNGGRDLPRLVLVVDEFRMLVEEAPGALAELMRVAAVGRSLGMHLVMATQRPQGALTADIRANVTASIALRMQHDAESSDVIGSPLAARIPVGLPGRAYLSVGGTTPIPFQSASLGLAAARTSHDGGPHHRVRVADARVWLRERRDRGPSEATPSPAESAAPLVKAASAAWASRGGAPVLGPLAPPLPDTLPLDEAGMSADPVLAAGEPLTLGVVDLPHEQRTAALTWSPSDHGHLALVGPGSAGTVGALAAVAAQLAGGGPTRHLYVLDADGSLALLRDHPRAGSYVGTGDLKRAARVLTRLAEECTNRLADAHSGKAVTPLILLISGWGAWITALRQSPQSAAEEVLSSLVRDGAPARLSVVAAGERELVSSRIFAGMPARLFFPLGSTDEARLSWPRLPAMPALKGRAAAVGTIVDGGPHAVQCYDAFPIQCIPASFASPNRRRRLREERPFRIDPLPAGAPAAVVAALSAGGHDRPHRLAVGLAGDEVEPFALRLVPGEVILALGAKESGKSAFLAALPTMNPALSFSSPASHERLAEWESLLQRLDGAPAPDARAVPVVLVDNADRLDSAENHLLSRLLEAGAAVVATAGYSANLYSRCPLALTVRTSGTGVAITPRTPNDGDVFGVRLDVPGRVHPGRAVAVVDGQQIEVQLGWHDSDTCERPGDRSAPDHVPDDGNAPDDQHEPDARQPCDPQFQHQRHGILRAGWEERP